MSGLTETGQGFQDFLKAYRSAYPDDVLTVTESVSADQEITAIVSALAEAGRYPLAVFDQVDGLSGVPVATNMFASRERVARLFGVGVTDLHQTYQDRSRNIMAPRIVASGPVCEVVEQEPVDLGHLPLLRHFDTDRAPYITNAVVIAEHPDTKAGNMSYHRSMLHSASEIATSLHSRGDLWRLFQEAKGRGLPLPVAMVIGAHPAFMLAASARAPYGLDERMIAGGLLGRPLDCVKTPRHGLAVPAEAEFVIEGVLEPDAEVEEGPFGEFTGYSSNRSTKTLFRVHTIMRRAKPMLVDVMGGRSAEHLNLARIPRESEMVEKLKQRFPSVVAVHYPTSGTHFHAYIAIDQKRQGEARQIMLGLLGWDPYLKTVIAVDQDVDITRDEDVLWALATHFQPHRDILMIDGLPGSALDPSTSLNGTTSRIGLDATRGAGFEGVRAQISDQATKRAAEIIARLSKS